VSGVCVSGTLVSHDPTIRRAAASERADCIVFAGDRLAAGADLSL
jgi:hypothetical protein